MWNVFGTPETVEHKDAVLRAHCGEIGRDSEAIERTLGCKVRSARPPQRRSASFGDLLERNRTPASRMEGDVSVWVGTPEQIAEKILSYRRVGFHTFIAELPAPYDLETMESLMNVVKPMVESA